MLNLESTDKLQVKTSSTADVDVIVAYVDVVIESAGPPREDIFNADKQLTTITTATTTDVCAAPAATVVRNIKSVSIVNKHASASNTVQAQINVSATLYVVSPNVVILLFGESLILSEGVWFHYDANGGVYGQALPVASDTVVGGIRVATQAEMEAASSVVLATTPGRQHFHPGVCKCWGKAVGAGTSLTVNYNVAGVVDTGTGRLGVTIGTDFSTANYAIGAALERSVTALTATGVEDHAIRNASPTAAVFEIESYDQTAITFVAQDPANYFWSCFGDHA